MVDFSEQFNFLKKVVAGDEDAIAKAHEEQEEIRRSDLGLPSSPKKKTEEKFGRKDWLSAHEDKQDEKFIGQLGPDLLPEELQKPKKKK